jgi:spermidine synthase
MEKIKNYKYEITLFIVDAVGMVLELAASRVLSPYFGSTNMVWTCVIAIILLSSSLGHFYGGKIADADNPKRSLKYLLTIASVLVMVIPIISDSVISNVANLIGGNRLGAIIATSLIFLLPSILLGTISPIVLKLRLDNLNDAGKTAGKISAFSTLGGILGTVLGGFLLIPNFGTMNIIFILAITVTLTKFIVDFNIKEKTNIFNALVLILSIIGIITYTNINNGAKESVLSGKLGETAYFDTEYGRVSIFNAIDNKDKIRVLNIDGGFETISFIDEQKKFEPHSKYIKLYNTIFDVNKETENVLMIGGAGYSFPKQFISSRDSGTIDVVEIDDKLTKIAEEYFFLDDLDKEYHYKDNKRLNIISDDGRMYINNNAKKYDAILNDAFSGQEPAKTLTTIEAVSKIKSSLNENGLYLTNIISALEGKYSRFFWAEGNTIKQCFNHVYYIPIVFDNENNYAETVRNIMVIASDNELSIDGAQEFITDANELVLTDDFCPVESMTYFDGV